MTPRRRRMVFVGLILLGAAAAAAFALSAFRDNVLYYFTPTQLATQEIPHGRPFRLGGMVSQGSVQRTPGSLEVSFVITDFTKDVPVKYSGVLPDLFREGQGVIARGRIEGGTFVAQEVLAKHDEKYMPPEISQSVRKAHDERAAKPAVALQSSNGTPPQ